MDCASNLLMPPVSIRERFATSKFTSKDPVLFFKFQINGLRVRKRGQYGRNFSTLPLIVRATLG